MDKQQNFLVFRMSLSFPTQVTVNGSMKNITQFKVAVDKENTALLKAYEEPEVTKTLTNVTTTAGITTGTCEGITYTLNSGEGTAEVSVKNNDNLLANTVIPDKVRDENGDVYTVTSIGSMIFYGTSKLTSVIIGKNVTNIGYSAFGECTNLNSISLTSTKMLNSSSSVSFYGLESSGQMYVPAKPADYEGSDSEYLDAWKALFTSANLPSGWTIEAISE